MLTLARRLTHIYTYTIRSAFVLVAFALAAGAMPPGVLAATVFGKNLIVNGDAEAGPGSTTGGTVASIPGGRPELRNSRSSSMVQQEDSPR